MDVNTIIIINGYKLVDYNISPRKLIKKNNTIIKIKDNNKITDKIILHNDNFRKIVNY